MAFQINEFLVWISYGTQRTLILASTLLPVDGHPGKSDMSYWDGMLWMLIR